MTPLNYIVDQTLFDNQWHASLSLHAHLVTTQHAPSEGRWLERFEALHTAIENTDAPCATVKDALVRNWLYASLDMAEVYLDKKDNNQLEAIQAHWLDIFKVYADALAKQNQKEEEA